MTGELFNAIIRQIGSIVKSGRSVAIDLKFDNDVFMLISPNGYEFANKGGIGDRIDDILTG